MRVQSARPKQASRVKFLFQCLLDALLHLVQRGENWHRHRRGRTGLLRSFEQRGLPSDLRGRFAKRLSV